MNKFKLLIIVGIQTIVFPVLPFSYSSETNHDLVKIIEQIESNLDARVGVAVYDIMTGRNWQYHANDRFPVASTFKTLACAGLLSRVDAGMEHLDRVVPIVASDIVTYSPITKTYVDANGVSLYKLCEATMYVSDNTAANLIVDAVGGTESLTLYLRSIGDSLTRIDRIEPELNEAAPGDVRDTTTPNAMANNLRNLILGDILTPESRDLLTNWMKGNKVGDSLFRNGVPSDWIVADKTGGGGYGSRSIAAVMWTPEGAPVVATVYITESNASLEARNMAIAKIGEAIAKALIVE